MSQVSCIIPYYEGSDTIARAIDSVIRSPHCLEVVVVVDASPRPLAPNLTSGQQELMGAGKLRVIRLSSNHGQAAARNMGASMSAGAYLSFLDQDDMYLPGYYESVVPILQTNPQFAALEVGIEVVQDGRIVLDDADPRYFDIVHSVPWNVVLRRNAFWSCGAFPFGPEFRTEVAGEDIVFKNALKQWFSVPRATNKFIRHHIRAGSATDRFLKRTEVVDGRTVFKAAHANEVDGTWERAANAHMQRARDALQAERAMAQGPLI